ncbi:MAG: hypothetical protein P0Y65_16195 [Candidatus Devosia phytovorans]|uniref:Polysaccharide chain length determinant N-terminal domain-containing protein n=1 Tax=Candidatus Devosia phytovorans TaxID=3121372 RepID=A0AAJ5VRZ4_9HYPH|nr:hypothetical protein [Devosia sp.]WEK03718.1 MAG: hypothetical protein P0Y65_16195 [Devosia sp.]
MENELFLVRYYWSLLRRHPFRWLLPMLVVAGIGGYVVMQEPRVYLSTARVAAQSPETSGTLVQSTVTNERLQFFEQRIFARDNLVALANTLELFPQMRASMTNGQIADTVRRLITLQVMPTNPNDPSSNSAVLTIGFMADTPEMAAAGAGEIVKMLILDNRTARLTEATDLRTFLEQEVINRRDQTVQLDAEWNAFIATNEALLPSRLSIYSTEMQELQGEMQTIQTASTTLAADTRVLETQLSVANRPIAGTETQLAALRQELATKQITYSDTHPEIISLRSRIAALENSTDGLGETPADATEPVVTAVTAEGAMLAERIASARQQEADYATRRAEIEERLSWLRGRIAQMPGVEADMLTLQRRHEAAEENLADMQNRLDTARIGERLETTQTQSQISIIDQPDVPTNPTSSTRTRNMAMVAALSLFAGFGILILLDLLDRTIKSKRDLRDILEGGTLAVIPSWKPNKGKTPRARLASLAGLLALGALSGSTSIDTPHEQSAERTQDAARHS